MIKFFRKIRLKLISESKFGNYLLYALGEIALVMIGILLAIQVNTWNTAKNERRELNGHLKFILEDLSSDRSQLNYLINRRDSIVNQSAHIITLYRESKQIPILDFMLAMGLVSGEKQFERNEIGFERVSSSKSFEANKYSVIRNLIRDYTKGIEDINVRENKQNTSSELMESKLLSNGFYDRMWDYIRAMNMVQKSKYNIPDSEINILSEISANNELKGLFMRAEWVMPILIKEYKEQIVLGEQLESEIKEILNEK